MPCRVSAPAQTERRSVGLDPHGPVLPLRRGWVSLPVPETVASTGQEEGPLPSSQHRLRLEEPTLEAGVLVGAEPPQPRSHPTDKEKPAGNSLEEGTGANLRV